MPDIIKTQTSPYSSKQMFDLVANFENYPNFLPFCSNASSQLISENEIHGTLFINKGPFKKSFTTRNIMIHGKPYKILIKLVNGPFKRLEGEWIFQDKTNSTGSEVILNLSYDMKSGLLNSALSKIFEGIAISMVDSFCSEAHKVYAE